MLGNDVGRGWKETILPELDVKYKLPLLSSTHDDDCSSDVNWYDQIKEPVNEILYKCPVPPFISYVVKYAMLSAPTAAAEKVNAVPLKSTL